MIKVWWVIGGILCLSGCTSKVSMDHFQAGMPYVTETKHLHDFHAVKIEGPFDVVLHNAASDPRVRVSAHRGAMPYIQAKVKHQTLWVQCMEGCVQYGQAQVSIYAPGKLAALSYRGTGRVTGRNLHTTSMNLSLRNGGTTELSGRLGLHRVKLSGGGRTKLSGVDSQNLDLTVKDKSKVQLSGLIRVASLRLSEGSWLSMYWIKAKRLVLRGMGDTLIQMAGVADVLDVELWDTARFKGRYLRAKESFVKTHDHAIAEITTLKHQHTLASDASDIYFYKVPKTKADFMAFNGSVLDMHEWSQDGKFDPYDQYNK